MKNKNFENLNKKQLERINGGGSIKTVVLKLLNWKSR